MNEWAQQSMRPDFCSKQQCMPRQTCLPALRVPTHACPQQTCLDIKNKEKTALSSDVWLTKAPSFTCLTRLSYPQMGQSSITHNYKYGPPRRRNRKTLAPGPTCLPSAVGQTSRGSCSGLSSGCVPLALGSGAWFCPWLRRREQAHKLCLGAELPWL